MCTCAQMCIVIYMYICVYLYDFVRMQTVLLIENVFRMSVCTHAYMYSYMCVFVKMIYYLPKYISALVSINVLWHVSKDK